MKRKLLSAVLSAAMVLSLAACGGTASDTATDASGENSEATEASEEAEVSEGESFSIGITAFAEHESLENCRKGFLQGLEEEGIVEGENLTVSYENAQTDMGTASTIADSFVADGVDLICAIATPSAMAAYNSTMSTDIPVIYTAVSDPVAAELADEDGNPVGNITGTSDQLPVEQQLQLIRAVLPDAKKIGIIYTTSETNSLSTIETYKELAGNYDFEIVEKGIDKIGDVELAANELATQVDCFSNLTDNTVVSAMQVEINAANEAGIPVFGSEIEQVKEGCLGCEGIDYVNLGVQTGKMAAKVLKGEAQASDMPFEVLPEAESYLNQEVAANLGIELSDEVKDSATEIFEEITLQETE